MFVDNQQAQQCVSALQAERMRWQTYCRHRCCSVDDNVICPRSADQNEPIRYNRVVNDHEDGDKLARSGAGFLVKLNGI